MLDSIEIRRLQPSEADAADYRTIRLAALETAPEAFGSVHAIELPRPMSHFVERLATSVVFGAYDHGQIVGMIGFKQNSGPKDSHKAFVWGFFVQPTARRRGIGATLMATLIAEARPVVEQLTLAVVRENVAAIALYERCGFSIYGVEPRALKTPTGYSDEVLMALRLR
jgi:ribosomal protein S18 acetylase RimI-like enzyme